MNFSPDDFNRNASALVSALQSTVGTEGDDGEGAGACSDNNDAGSFVLTDWELRHDNNGWNTVSYLAHPPVIISTRVSASPLVEREDDVTRTAERATGGGDDDNYNYDDLEEEGIILDDQCYAEETIPDYDTKGDEQMVRVDTQWSFNIIYSSTYQAPVLYFRVQDADGNPVGRQRLLQLLDCEHRRSKYTASNDFPTDAWEFVSQEENPVTGLSSFFLHPCQSAQRLQFLTIAAIDPGLTSTVDAGFTKKSILWSWMSMILPAVGHPIPPDYFRSIQNRIARLL
eukprot:jgi/Psemu1/294033/fgenesh1_pm.6_\